MAIPPLTTELPIIPSAEFTKGKLIGKGGFGKVYLGQWQATIIAVKELLEQTISDTFQKEAKLMDQCNHPNTVRLYGICIEEGKLALLMEYLEKGSLHDILKNSELSLAWPRRFSIAADIGKGLAYLHGKSIIHRDLKSLNILIAKDDTAKITDFGFAKVKTDSQMTSSVQVGTVRWTAPELVQQNIAASTTSDIYSFGMVLWEIAARCIPFSQAANEFIITTWKLSNTHEIIPTDCPAEYAAIIQKCWVAPSARPSAKIITQELSLLQQKNSPATLATEIGDSSFSKMDISITKPSEPTKGNVYVPNYISNFPIAPIQPVAAQLPSIAFGKAEWAKYFGDVGIEPPLPADIDAILSAPCPFWSDKKVQETHLLVLVPQTVNGKPLTLKMLGKLIQKPLQGTPTKYSDLYLGVYIDAPAAKSHWVLMTRDIIEGSRNKIYRDQQALIQAKASYEVPSILDATIVILMKHVRTGTRLYSDSPWTATQCQEKYDNKDWQLVVGGFSAAGLYVHRDGGDGSVGLAGLRKL